MAKQQSPRKKPVCCPYCEKEQQESILAKSTFCRHCGRHYEIGDAVPADAGKVILRDEAERSEAKKRSLGHQAERFLGDLLGQSGDKEIFCFDCGQNSTVSAQAHSSFCPRCSAYIDLQDVHIQRAVSRSVQTHGGLIIDSSGALSGSKSYVSDAVIEGGLDSILVCSGHVRVNRKGIIKGSIHARTIEISRNSEVKVLGGVFCESILIKGTLFANVCALNCVSLWKTAILNGAVISRLFKVAKGANFEGSMEIGQAFAKTYNNRRRPVEEVPGLSGSDMKSHLAPAEQAENSSGHSQIAL